MVLPNNNNNLFQTTETVHNSVSNYLLKTRINLRIDKDIGCIKFIGNNRMARTVREKHTILSLKERQQGERMNQCCFL